MPGGSNSGTPEQGKGRSHVIAGAQGGAAAAGHMEQMLLQVAPGRFDA